MTPCRLAALALVVAFLGAATTSGTAAANDYVVTTCDAAPGDVNNAWNWSESGPAGHLEYGSDCASTGEFGGVWARENFAVNNSTNTTSGYWTFQAPLTTAITGITYSRFLKTYTDADWRAELLRSDGSIVEQCVLVGSASTCSLGASGGASITFNGLATSQLRFGARCVAASMVVCTHGASIHRVEAVLYGSSVTLHDPQKPSVSSLKGTLTADGWLRGTKTVAVAASDATGIGTLTLTQDNVPVRVDTRTCDYTRPAPCDSPGSNVESAWTPVDTSTLPDGTHTLVGSASDAAGNTMDGTPVTIQTDNNPPAAPLNLTGADDDWSPSPSRTLSWTLPSGQVAPITGATVTLCPSGGSCANTAASSTTSRSITLPSPGTYTGNVFLTDAAGNTAPANGTAFTLRYDRDAPPAPTLGAAQQQGRANDFIVPVTVADPGPAPLAQFDGDLCRPDGSSCQALASQSSLSQVRTAVPGDGTWRLRVRAVDAAGNEGQTAETTLVYVAPTPTGPPPPTSTPTVEPSPTPSSTPPPQIKKRPRLRLTRAILRKGTLAVRARAAVQIGTVVVAYRVDAQRRRRVAKRVRLRHGRLAVTLRLSPTLAAPRRGRLELRYAGSRSFRAGHVARTIRRR